MIHYHGGRHTTWQVAVEIWQRRHALVSYADPQQIAIAAEVAQSFALDNGAFSVWKQGIAVDWKGYYAWVEEWWRHPGFDWAVVPDVIDGDEAANDALVAEWPFGKHVGVPVWHLHETLDRLARLANNWPRVALGSSGQFRTPGTPVWWGRMQQAMEVVCDCQGRPKVKLHGLRMLRPALCKDLPLASADSAGGRCPCRSNHRRCSHRHERLREAEVHVAEDQVRAVAGRLRRGPRDVKEEPDYARQIARLLRRCTRRTQRQ